MAETPDLKTQLEDMKKSRDHYHERAKALESSARECLQDFKVLQVQNKDLALEIVSLRSQLSKAHIVIGELMCEKQNGF
jgi:uncharacterized coiled-coil DUF342 family protein